MLLAVGVECQQRTGTLVGGRMVENGGQGLPDFSALRYLLGLWSEIHILRI